MLLDCFLEIPFDAKSNVDTAINTRMKRDRQMKREQRKINA